MANSIKQGDAYALPVTVALNGEALDPAEVETLEIMVGGVRKLYPGDVRWDETERCFYVPLTQEETFAFPADEAVAVDLRVRFRGGNVIGARRMAYVTVADAVSEEVI